MYVRHSAWLNATPEGQKGEPRSRREQYVEGDPILTPPELSSYEQHLVSLWREAGTVSQKGMGIDALDWDVLIAWADKFYSETDIEWVKNPDRPRDKPVPIVSKYCTLPDIDIQMIRQMSQEYCWMASEATDNRCMCPIEIDQDVEISECDAELMAQSLLDNLRAMGFLGEDGNSI